jgi:hypothetical protein
MPTMKITRGDDVDRVMTFKDGDGAAIPITNYTVWFTVKIFPDDTDEDAVLQKEITTHTDAPNGISALVITKAQTLAVPVGEYYFDFQIKDGSNKIKTLGKGILLIEQGQTDADGT